MTSSFNVNMTISFDPLRYEIFIGRQDAYQHHEGIIDQPKEQPVNNIVDESKNEQASKDLLEQVSQGDLSAQNRIAEFQKKQEVIVIDDHVEPTAEVLLQEFIKKVASGLDTASAEIQETMQDSAEVFQAIAASIDEQATQLDEEKTALFKALVDVLRNGSEEATTLAAAKKLALENIDGYAEAVKKAREPKQNDQCHAPEYLEKEVVVDNSAEELRLKNLQNTSEELMDGLKMMSKDDLGILWQLLVLDEASRNEDLKQLQGTCAETIRILSFLESVKPEERDAFVNAFTSAVEKLRNH